MKSEQIHLRVSVEEFERVKALAVKKRTSVSSLVLELLAREERAHARRGARAT